MTTATVDTGNPIVVSGTASTSEKIIDRLTFVRFIQWYKPTTVTHLLNITDKNGALIAKEYCDTANKSIWIPVYTTCDGIYTDNMDSGHLLIYIR
jgi:hypothetical protein